MRRGRSFALIAVLIGAVVLVGSIPAAAVAPALSQVGTIAVGSAPRAIVASPDGDRIYVLNSGTPSLSIIDTASNAVEGTLSLSNQLDAMIASTDGRRLFLLGSTSSTLVVFDTQLQQAESVGIGNGAETMLFSPDGTRLYIANSIEAQIVVVNTADPLDRDVILLPDYARLLAVSPDGSSLYVATSAGVQALSSVDGSLMRDLGYGPGVQKGVLSPDGGSLFVADGSGDVRALDTVHGGALWARSLLDNTVALELSEDGSLLYRLGSAGPSTPSSFDVLTAADGSPVGSYAPSSELSLIVPDPGSSLVWLAGEAEVELIDPTTSTRETFYAGEPVWGLAVVPAVGLTYALTDTGGVSVLETAVPRIRPATQSVSATHGTSIVPTASLAVGYFSGAVAYTVDPALPVGLALDPATGVVSGTPTGAAQGAVSYTITATGATSGVATATIAISVAAAAPGSPGNVAAVPGARQAFVSWSVPVDDGGDASLAYTVTASPSGATCTTTSTACVVTGLTAGQTYAFGVTATSAGGTSAAATTAGILIAASVAPALPPATTPPATLRLIDANGVAVTSITAGQKLFVEAAGFAPNSSVEAILYSVPVVVGSGTVDGSGAARFGVSMPNPLAAGRHTLVVAGFSPTGATAFAALGVTAPSVRGVLARSGSEPDAGLWSAGLILLLAGAAMAAASRSSRARVG